VALQKDVEEAATAISVGGASSSSGGGEVEARQPSPMLLLLLLLLPHAGALGANTADFRSPTRTAAAQGPAGTPRAAAAAPTGPSPPICSPSSHQRANLLQPAPPRRTSP